MFFKTKRSKNSVKLTTNQKDCYNISIHLLNENRVQINTKSKIEISYIKLYGFEYRPNANSINEMLQSRYAVVQCTLSLPIRCALS